MIKVIFYIKSLGKIQSGSGIQEMRESSVNYIYLLGRKLRDGN